MKHSVKRIHAVVMASCLIVWVSAEAAPAPFQNYQNWVQSQNNNAVNSATTTNPQTFVPGYNANQLPSPNYYNNQDVSGLTSDGMTAIPNDTAATQAWTLTNQPKLQFSPTDPIITNADNIMSNTSANGAQITSSFTACNNTVATTPPTYEERQCTATMVPVDSTCDKTLGVQVLWDPATCTPGSYIEATQMFNGLDGWTIRALCEPEPQNVQLTLEVSAFGGNGSCTGFTSTTVPEAGFADVQFSNLRPHWYGGCQPDIHAYATGSCTTTDCTVTAQLKYVQQCQTYQVGGQLCDSPVTQTCLQWQGSLCVVKDPPLQENLIGTINYNFTNPHYPNTYTTVDSWTDGCASLEAQVP